MATGAMLLFACALAPQGNADPGTTTYYPYFGASNLGTITSGTTLTLTRLGTLSTYPLTLGTGGTANFTVTLVMSDSGAIAGDKMEVPVTYPAGTGQQALAIYDSGTGGTLLHSSTATSVAGSALLDFVNVTGTAWTYTPKGDVGTRTLGGGVQAALQQPINSNAGLLSGSQVAVYANVPGLNSISSGPGQYSISGTPVSSGSSVVSGSAMYAGSAVTSGSASQSGTAYSLGNATGTLSTQASINLPPVLSSTSIPGCVEDLDGDQPAGSGTNSVPPNSAVTTWVALAGSNAVALSSSNAPIFQPGFGMYFNGSAAMSIPSVVTGTSYTVVVDFTPGLASNSPALFTGNGVYGQIVFSSTNNVNAGINLGLQQNYYWGWNAGHGGTAATSGEGNTIMTSMDSTGLMYEDGYPQLFYTSQGFTNSIANTTCYLGNEGAAVGGYNFTGWIRRVRIFVPALTGTAYTALWQSDAARYKQPASNELVVDGDSISSVIPGSALTKSGLAAYLNGSWDIRSAAWGGKTLSEDAQDDAAFAAMQDIRHPAPVVLEWLGTNDIYGNLTSGTAAYNSLAAGCLARRGAGNRVVVETMLPRASANEESQRQIFNALLRSNFRQFSDALIDLKDLAPTMDSYSTNFTTINGTNYLTTTGSTQFLSDLVHPTAYGATLIAQAEAAVINGMIPAPPSNPVPSTSGQILVSTTSIGMNAAWTGATPGGNVTVTPDGSGLFALKGTGAMSGLVVSSEIGNSWSSWYPFTFSATQDMIGGNDLVNDNGVTTGTGIGGGAAVFTGSNVLVAPSPIFASGSSFTATCWFNLASVSSAQSLLGAYNVGANGAWVLNFTGSAMQAFLENAAGVPVSATLSFSAANSWHFGAITYNAATNVETLYLDGVETTATLASGSYSAPGVPMVIGGFYSAGSINASGSQLLTGSVSDVRLYKGKALSQAALNTIWTAGMANGVVSQTLAVSGTAAPPANSGTAAGWAIVTYGTSSYKLPLYQ